MLPLIVVGLLAGVGAVVVGLSGWRVGDEPRCRKCGFDLTGLPGARAGACPECGADLSRRKAVRIGVRRRRWVLVGVGSLVTGPAVVGGVLVAALLLSSPASQPSWALALRAQHGPYTGADATLEEIMTRSGAGTMPDEQVVPVADRALALFLDDARPWDESWNGTWAKFADWAARRGLLAPGQLAEYTRAAFEVRATPQPAACEERVGIMVGLERSPRTWKDAVNTLPFVVALDAITSDGTRHAITPSRSGRPNAVKISGVNGTSAPGSWNAPAPEHVGLHDIEAELSVYLDTTAQSGPRLGFSSSTTVFQIPELVGLQIADGHVIESWTETRPVRIRVVEPGGLLTPVATDAALDDARRSIMATLRAPEGFEAWLEEGAEDASGDPRARCEYEISMGTAEVGGEFDVWLVAPNDHVLRAWQSTILRTHDTRTTATGDGMRRWMSRHGYHGRVALRHRNPSAEIPPFEPEQIPGEGWRMVFEPSEKPMMRHALDSDPLREDWTPPPTLRRRIVLQFTPLPEGLASHVKAAGAATHEQLIAAIEAFGESADAAAWSAFEDSWVRMRALLVGSRHWIYLRDVLDKAQQLPEDGRAYIALPEAEAP